MNSRKGFKGISFPFRFSGSGGVATSTTNVNDFSHIEESIRQIIYTLKGERVFETHLGSEVGRMIFSISDDETEMELLKFYIKEAITEQEPRVEVSNVTIAPYEGQDGINKLIVDINIFVTKYLKSQLVRVELQN